MNAQMESADYKTCSRCDQTKPLDKFHAKKGGKFGRRADCTECVALYQERYRKQNSEVIKKNKQAYHRAKPHIHRNNHLKSTYGITLEQYNIMLIAQNGKCKLCSTADPRNGQHVNFYVDHCHKTGKIRGLLCYRCNSAIGYFGDSPERCYAAGDYLKEHQ